MPGCRGNPAVITTTSDPAVSRVVVRPDDVRLEPLDGRRLLQIERQALRQSLDDVGQDDLVRETLLQHAHRGGLSDEPAPDHRDLHRFLLLAPWTAAMLPSGPAREPGLSSPGGCAGGPSDADTQKMSTPPTTRPETWVPAGAEREGTPGGPPVEGPASRKRAAVTLPPKESLQPTQKAAAKAGVRTQLKRMLWAVVGAALPWAWFLVRDLGPAMQLVALALPILVAVAILGVAISAIDEKRATSLLVIGSLGVFGWTTVMGPRSMQPTRAPQDPVRVVEVSLPAEGPRVQSVIAALQKEHADVAFLAVPSKKDRAAVASSDAFDTSVVVGGSVVLSAYPVKILPLPKGLPKGLVTRIEVDRPGRPFIAYAARATDALQAAMDEPLTSSG